MFPPTKIMLDGVGFDGNAGTGRGGTIGTDAIGYVAGANLSFVIYAFAWEARCLHITR